MAEFDALIADKTRDFLGREWVFAAIQAWLDNAQGPNFYIITGEPGIGKSAIAARLVQFSEGVVLPPAECPRLSRGWLAAQTFAWRGALIPSSRSRSRVRCASNCSGCPGSARRWRESPA